MYEGSTSGPDSYSNDASGIHFKLSRVGKAIRGKGTGFGHGVSADELTDNHLAAFITGTISGNNIEFTLSRDKTKTSVVKGVIKGNKFAGTFRTTYHATEKRKASEYWGSFEVLVQK